MNAPSPTYLFICCTTRISSSHNCCYHVSVSSPLVRNRHECSRTFFLNIQPIVLGGFDPTMDTQQKINENIVWFGTSPLSLLADWKTCVKYSYAGFLNDLSISDEIRTLISQVMTADRPKFDKLRECCFELLEFMFYSVTQSSMQKTSKILSTIKTSGTTLQPDNHPRRVQSSSSSSSRWGFTIIIADVAAAAAVAV